MVHRYHVHSATNNHRWVVVFLKFCTGHSAHRLPHWSWYIKKGGGGGGRGRDREREREREREIF